MSAIKQDPNINRAPAREGLTPEQQEARSQADKPFGLSWPALAALDKEAALRAEQRSDRERRVGFGEPNQTLNPPHLAALSALKLPQAPKPAEMALDLEARLGGTSPDAGSALGRIIASLRETFGNQTAREVTQQSDPIASRLNIERLRIDGSGSAPEHRSSVEGLAEVSRRIGNFRA